MQQNSAQGCPTPFEHPLDILIISRFVCPAFPRESINQAYDLGSIPLPSTDVCCGRESCEGNIFRETDLLLSVVSKVFASLEQPHQSCRFPLSQFFKSSFTRTILQCGQVFLLDVLTMPVLFFDMYPIKSLILQPSQRSGNYRISFSKSLSA